MTVVCLPQISLAQLPDLRPISIEPIGVEGEQAAHIDDQSINVQPVAFQQPPLPEPIPRDQQPEPHQNNNSKKHSDKSEVDKALSGDVSAVDSLNSTRTARTAVPSVDAVLGSDSKLRQTTDTGNLIGKSLTVRGVASQQRTPIVTDTRIRGQRVGQVLASGSYWSPVRMDLDTMMNKIDSRLVDSLVIVKGPYSSRYGPGFSFVDIDMLSTPRYEFGAENHGSTSGDFQSNGSQWYGRQTFFGGSTDWGYRVSYGQRKGSDYTTGDGDKIASSYDSGDLNVAFGKNFTPNDRLEFNYLRLDQHDLEFPGLYYDIRKLKTDGYELKYTGSNPAFCDLLMSEVWYNRTAFTGDTLNFSKQSEIPLPGGVVGGDGIEVTDGNAITDGSGSSLGHRTEAIFGELGVDHWSLGTDFNLQRQALNDIELSLPANDNNFPLPPSRSVDVGFYVEKIKQRNDWLRTNFGARVDNINTNSTDIVQGVEVPITDLVDADLEQNFLLWSTYGTAEAALTDHWTATSGFGFGQRPPTLTEMYVQSSFIGSLQQGLTFLLGDPLLAPEQLKQIDFGFRGEYEHFRGGVNAYHAWIHNYITYDLFTDPTPDGGLPQGAAFVNTDQAILRGIDAFGQYDVSAPLTFFGNLSYVEGTDLSRDSPARLTEFTERSGVSGVNREALPGISPLDSRVGWVLHDPAVNRRWGIELSARMVARQTRIASTLLEQETPGFTTFDIRSFKRIRKSAMMTAGVENFTNRYYREHLDFRTGTGVFRPGVNFYTGFEVTY